MKNLFLLISFACLTCKAQLNFTVTSNTGTDSITCIHPVIVLTAANNFSAPVNYSWAGPGLSATGNTAAITTAGTYTVNATSTNSVNSTQTITVYGSTTIPNISVITATQTLNCYTPQITAQGMSTASNVVFSWSVPGSTVPVLIFYLINFKIS